MSLVVKIDQNEVVNILLGLRFFVTEPLVLDFIVSSVSSNLQPGGSLCDANAQLSTR